MRKSYKWTQNSATGISVWLLFCITFLLTLSACKTNTPAPKETPSSQIPSATMLPSPSPTTTALSRPLVAISPSPSPTPIISSSGQVFSPTTLPSPLPNAAASPLNQVSPTKTLSPFPASAKAKFSMSSAIQSVPQDILQEVGYFPGGAGHGSPNCNDHTTPVIEYAPTSSELMEWVDVIACGWQNDEEILGTIIYPNQTVYEKLSITSYGQTYISFFPTLTDPIGTYTVILTRYQDQLMVSIDITEPPGPQIYWQHNDLFLYKFLPNEKVRIFAYKLYEAVPLEASKIRLEGWQTYQVDSSGQLLIKTEKNYSYVIIGDASGEFPKPYHQSMVGKNSCPGAPTIRITIGKRARVTNGDALRVREYYGLLEKINTTLKAGTVIDILRGPMCEDNINWWEIKTKDGLIGWVAEGDLKEYYLEPWN